MQAGPFVREAARLHSPLTDQQATHYHHGILTAIRESNVAGMVDGLNADINQAFEILERAGSHAWDARGIAL
jgi:DNA-binding GntR family transcriptional regulator